MTSFIGREKDIEALERLLNQHRLVTLTGPGGSGKTRLALELVKAIQAQQKTQVWLVDVSAVGDPALLAQVTASALGVPASGSPTQALIERFHKSDGLLVLDNCEHVADSCAQLISAVATECPAIRFLVTSREPVRTAGESTWRVQPLGVPVDGADLNDIAQAESVRLFVERGRLASTGFRLDQSNAGAIAEICRLLDGLPLALELAAARVGMLSPSQIVGRLDDRFSLLAGGGRPLPARHQTLKATLEWSYELLPEPERCLFRRLSVFTGSFNLEAVEAVCGVEPLDTSGLLDFLGRLIDKSLVAATGEVRGELRYRLLDSTRAFANEMLSAEPSAELIVERHARLYASIALEAGRRLSGPDAPDWIDLVGEEIDNLRAALVWAIKNDRQLALGICASLAGYWDLHGWLYEGRHWLERALDDEGGAPSTERAGALAAAGMLAYRQSDFAEAYRRYEASLEVATTMGDRALSARALAGLGDVHVIRAEFDEAVTRFQASLELYRGENDLLSVARGLGRLGNVHHGRSEFENAERLYQESLTAFRQLDDPVGVANELYSIGVARWGLEKFQSALTYLKESLTIRHQLGDALGIAWSSSAISYTEVRLGNIRAACQPLIDGFNGCDQAGDLRGLSIALDIALGLFIGANRAKGGIRAASAAAAFRRIAGIEQIPWLGPVIDGWLAQARAELQSEEVEQEETLGRSMSPKAALQFALDHINSIAEGQRASAQSPLTRRERQIAELVANGLTNREIADRMHISERTADSHVQHTLTKLGFKSRAQIAAWHARNSGRESALSNERGTGSDDTAPSDSLVNRFVATILMLDIVGSTARVAEIGDAGWRELLDEHYRLARLELGRHHGVEVDTAGDGLLATFDGPARAIRCARGIQRADRAIGLLSRAGVHTGEVERAGKAIRGIAVHITARLSALGHADEILVSSTARELSAGSGLRFLDRGVHQLKGLSDPRQVFAVSN